MKTASMTQVYDGRLRSSKQGSPDVEFASPDEMRLLLNSIDKIYTNSDNKASSRTQQKCRDAEKRLSTVAEVIRKGLSDTDSLPKITLKEIKEREIDLGNFIKREANRVGVCILLTLLHIFLHCNPFEKLEVIFGQNNIE